MTVAELQTRMGAGEVAEWMAFARIDPFGAEIDDYRAAVGPALTVNMSRGKDAPAVLPFALLPWRARQEAPRQLTPEETAREIDARVFGIVDIPKTKS